MFELERLISIIEKRARKSLPKIIDITQDSLETRFYLLVRDRKVKTDAAAIKELYGEKGDAKGYKMLKSRLKKKLYTALDSVELQDSSLKPWAQDEKQCSVMITRATTLVRIGERSLSLKVISQAEAIAKDLKMASLLIRCNEIKCIIYFGQNDYNAFKACEAELETFRKIRKVEEEAEVLYFNSRFGMKQQVAVRKENLKKLPDVLQELELKWVETGSPLIYEYLHILRIQFYELIGDYQKIITSADSAAKLTADGLIPDKMLDSRFNKFIKLYALLQLRQYKQGLDYAESIEQNFIYGSYNWSSFIENYFLLALQSKDYKLAASLFDRFSSSGAIQVNTEAAKERWALFVEFYNLMADNKIKWDDIVGEDANALLKQNVKDKEGFNVAIIILKFFEMLQQDKLEDTALYSDRLRKYMSKHLAKKEADRPRLFLKLLLLIFRNNQDAIACRTKGRYLFDKLKKTPVPGSAFTEVEIVPYEQLWERALAILENKTYSGSVLSQN